DAQIFQPLGMTHTHFHDDPGHVMKQRAMSYEKDGKGGFRISYLQNFDKVGAGGLYSTIDDLRKWDENFYTHQVGGDALQQIIHTRGVLTSGDTLPYAFGNNIGTVRGLRVTEHGGSMMGYKAYVLRFPDQHLSVITTCNLGAIDPGPLSHAVAAVFLGDKMSPETARTVAQSARQQAVAPSASSGTADVGDASLVGDYFSEDLGVTYSVRRTSDGTLALSTPNAPPKPLVRTGASTFRVGSTLVTFEGTTTMVLTVSRIGEMRLGKR
ncbi:MAG: serine hydrolase domain-containing protein, partial [bacterium]